MNQKNIFSIISVLLILQGVGFWAMKTQTAASTYPTLDATGLAAVVSVIELVCAISILTGIITWAVRSTPGIAWAYALGFLIVVATTLKHMYVDNINVPMPALIIQVLILLSCAYLWMQERKAPSVQAA